MKRNGKRWLLLSAGVLALAAMPGAQAQDKAPMSEVKAKELIESGTAIQACADAKYTFQTVQIGTKLKQKYGGQQVDFYPVHARFAVNCRYGTELMRAEVDLTTAFYKDSFGAWAASGPDYSGDQTWDNTQSDVRCRVQNLAHLTVDANNKVTATTPAKDQGFMGCTVQSKAAD